VAETALRREFVSTSADETRAIGVQLGQAAEPGDVFLLEGEFGAGKTVLVQGLAEGLGVTTYVASPSFVIVTQHTGRLTLYHVDLYRADCLDPELEDTVADVVEAGGVTAIEWPQLLPPSLRQGATVVRFERRPDDERHLTVETLREPLARSVDAASRLSGRSGSPAVAPVERNRQEARDAAVSEQAG
jgi:tRNA threonylcarbamoyladenosine biosynthesis protein TsaE